MDNVFTTLDFVIFFGTLIFAMVVGFVAGRKEETSEDYFLAGRSTPWWGVAGSIFGSNVSANHMVGMMGIGFSVGFAQSHFELGAIVGLMVLCYGFLPVYRKLRVYTLSEYLARRYDERSRLAYAIIMVVIMVIVQMVPALYIGARSICVLIGEGAVEQVDDTFVVNTAYYAALVIALAVISASYTIFGGLKAVIWTDVIQSVLLLGAGILVAILTFEALGGWGAMMALDAAEKSPKMQLYLPMNDPNLPWTGVLTGLMAMHCYYWGTNQFIVQRALSARSDRDARLGIVAAGFLKLLIPFFAIGTGVAAFYLFREKVAREIPPDTAFTELVKLVVPIGSGIVGLIMAGVIGAILSSIDSMMNSAATLITVDVYRRYVRPDATDRQMIAVGRIAILVFVVLAAVMAIFVINPNSKENFFLQIVDYQAYLTPGVLVAFFMGIFWRRSTPAAGIVTILSGIFFSWFVEFAYARFAGGAPAIVEVFGENLHFFHRVVVIILMCVAVNVIVSCLTRRDSEKERLVWAELGGHDHASVVSLVRTAGLSLVVFAVLGCLMCAEILTPTLCAWMASVWTLVVFLLGVLKKRASAGGGDSGAATPPLLTDDRFWAAWLCSLAVFMMYYFF